VAIDSHNQEGWTALCYACSFGHDTIVKQLLGKMKQLGWRCAAHRALLIANNAKVDASARDGATSLMHAASSGNERIVRLLLQVGTAFIAFPRLAMLAVYVEPSAARDR
jgi:ankyrin repeat protein